jgi:hypothetical protein
MFHVKQQHENVGVLDANPFYTDPLIMAEQIVRPTNGNHPAVMAEWLGLAQLWCHTATAGAAERLQDEHIRTIPAGWELANPEWSGSGRPWWLRFYRRGGRTVNLTYPALNTQAGVWGAWADAPTPEVLLRALVAYRDAVGRLPERSPGSTAFRLVREALGELPSKEDAMGGAFPLAQGPCHYYERPEPWLLGRTYLHSYDKRGQYLAALHSLRLGRGVPYWLDRFALGAVAAAWQRSRDIPAGYFRLAAPPACDALFSPPCLEAGAGWYPTPALELALEHGHLPKLEEAWCWPEAGAWLEPWYERLRSAYRAATAPVDGDAAAWGIARRAVKATYTQGLGWFASRAWKRDNDPLYRPDVLDFVITKAAANMRRNIAKLPATSRPFACDVDCLYFLTNEPSPLTFAAQIGLTLGGNPGNYAIHDAAVPMTPELRAKLGELGSASELRELLRAGVPA